MRGLTYGAEHEWGDFPLDTPLPPGYGRDRKDITIVNSNGIANDPSGKLYRFGGEINTPPTSTPKGQVECLRELKKLLPNATINHRSNLHIHIRLPGLRDDLKMLKRVQKYIHNNMRSAFPIIEPLPRPKYCSTPEELQGALRRWRRRRVSHQTLLTHGRLSKQLEARSPEEFFRREVPQSKSGKPLWACQPRLCVSLRQLLETDTVEFRHFPGTLDEAELLNCIIWCHQFLIYAVDGMAFDPLLHWAGGVNFPQFPPYVHWREVRYRATVHDGTLSKAEIARNIKAIEDGVFEP
jgi:hypothetical protein